MSRNPLAKILVACAGIAVVALVRWPLGPGLGLAAVAFVAAGCGTDVAGRTARSGLLAAAGVALVGFVLVTLQGKSPSDQASFVLASALAVGVMVAMVQLVIQVTDRRDVGLDLERRGLPRSLAFAVVGLAGAPGALGRRRGRIVEAQLARGVPLDRGLIDRVRAVPTVAVPLMVASLHELADRTLARESRGISQPGRRTLLDVPPETALDRLLEIGGAVVVGVLLIAHLAGVG